MWDRIKKAGAVISQDDFATYKVTCLDTVPNFLEAVSHCIPRHLRYVPLPCLDYCILSLDFTGCRERVLAGQKSIYDSLHLRPINSSRPLLRGINTGCSYNVQNWVLFIFLLILISGIHIYLLQSPRHKSNKCFTSRKLTKEITITPETHKDSFTEGITYACH